MGAFVSDFHTSLDYITLCAARWDFELMRMACYVRRAEVNLHPYSEEGLRLVRGLTPMDREFMSMESLIAYGKPARAVLKKKS